MGKNAKPGFPKFTNQVQHLLDKVLPWDKTMNNFRLKSAVRFADLAKPENNPPNRGNYGSRAIDYNA